ncbi:hypothetical protein [Bifidobacterium moukalabense]|uniref:hypothetical protein n=1 Tax=Bifidobacterium moukalabense TaxID=1333651 RepID=UPI0010F9FCF1|nr:hypothetical protein [Bifidobacterium moukalabense]
MCAAILSALAIMMLIECVLCNLPFWRTLAASGDSAAADNTLGPGLERTADGMLTVTDPTQAYLQVVADGTSAYIRIDPVSVRTIDKARQETESKGTEQPLTTIRVRPDADRAACTIRSVSLSLPRSLYVKAEAGRTVRVQILEPKGSLIPIQAVRANVRVPFEINPLRIGLMVVVFVLLLLWRPNSRLWKVPLDASSVRQRAAFAALMAVPAVITVWNVVWQIRSAVPLQFHADGMYTYDFDQYDHVAQALRNGHAWLDLEVPKELREAADPYSIETRQRLLNSGVSPIYWDYAYYQGHWYSYFGVLPAVMLFLPFRVATSLWVEGGLMLPSGAAVLLLMFGFLVFACLLTVRLIERIRPGSSIAAVSMICVFVLLASNSVYLWYRTNFYSVPIAASLFLSTLGLWLWLGAAKPLSPVDSDDMPAAEDASPLSLPHLAAGSVCIAANLGCRPTFTVVALLAFPIFRTQIRSIVRRFRARRKGGRGGDGTNVLHLLRAPLAVLVPALIVVIPLFAYNAVRFGSIFDFGSSYQMTVTDMTGYRQPFANFLLTCGYYLFLPLRFTGQFPFLAVSPTPLPSWGFTEAMPGGLFMTTPLVFASLALPFLRRRMRRLGLADMWHMLMACLILGLLVMALDSRLGGLGWRYIADFGWLFALAALPALLFALGCCRPRLGWLIRAGFLALLLFSIAVTVLSLFMPGREDELIRSNSTLFLEVQSWFALP